MKVSKIHKSGGFILLTSIAFFLFAGGMSRPLLNLVG